MNTSVVEVPEWRRTARAGVSLAAAQKITGALTPVKSLPAELGQIIRREAQPRWLLPSIGMVTPQYLESILRGALVGNHVFQWQLFDLMEDTWPRLVKNLNELKSAAIREVTENWRAEAWAQKGEKPSVTAEEKAALLEEALQGMTGDAVGDENGLEGTLYDMLDAWEKGTSLLEIDWEQRGAGDLGMIWAPRTTYWVHPRNYAWGSDGRLGLVLPGESPGRAGQNYVDTSARMPSAYERSGGFTEVPADKFLVAIRKARTGHPLGGPLLRPLAWWWCAANFSADWLLNFAQIFGLPIRWANYAPQTPIETINKINSMLENMGSAAYGSFPAGTTIEFKEASMGQGELPQSAILDRADKQCDLLILGQTLTTEVRKEGGSRALGEVHAEVRDDVIHAAASFCARVINTQLVPALMGLNYGERDEERPRLVPNDQEPELAKGNAEVLQLAVETGIPVPVAFALEKLNIPAAEEGEELVQAPAAAAAVGGASGEVGGANGEQSGEAAQAVDRLRGRGGLGGCGVMHAHGRATEKLINNVLEDLSGVEAKWLGGVKPALRALVAKAGDARLSDKDFVRAVERFQRELPELFNKLDRGALAEALGKAMGTAMVNGVLRGRMERGGGGEGK